VSEQSGYPGAPPGWYPDPAGGPGQRWWDGYAWSDATVLPQRPPPPPWASTAPPSQVGSSQVGSSQMPPSQVAPWAASERLSTRSANGLVQEELSAVPVARFAVVMPAVYLLANLVLQRINANQLRAIGHQFRIDWDDAQRGITPPAYHGPSSSYTPITVVIGLVTVAAVIMACMWQHRAASAGRALGFPSSRSPAWGVGSWFVPIVNLWMPYGAIRDCLPPEDPHRPRVLQWWIAWLVAGWVSSAAGICALFSTGVALALSIPAALACLAVIAMAPGIVTAISHAHRAASGQVTEGSGALSG
jgi:hypothetical protein